MTIQPFKNHSEKELFEKELKDMILTPTSEHRKITKWQSAINQVHSKWCKDNGYPTTWYEVRVGRPKRQANKQKGHKMKVDKTTNKYDLEWDKFDLKLYSAINKATGFELNTDKEIFELYCNLRDKIFNADN